MAKPPFGGEPPPPLSGGVFVSEGGGREVEVEGFPDRLDGRPRGEVRASVGVQQADGGLAGVRVHLEPDHRLGTEGDTDGTISEQFARVAVFGSGMHIFVFWIWVGLSLAT